MNTKPTLLALSTAMVLGTLSTQAHAELVITEYIEGSSSNKALEITNLGSSPINLDDNVYQIGLYSNGKTEIGNNEILTGTLAPNQSIVFHNASAADEFKVGIESTITYFNGDDALVLTKDGVVIDRFGKLGEDPGSFWSDANDTNWSTQNKTLRRKSTVTTGETNATADFPGSDNQWLAFDTDTADGLGCPGEGACGAAEGVLLITEYIEGSGNNKAVEISNVGGAPINLDEAVYKITRYNNGSTEESHHEVLSGTLEAGASIVFHNPIADAEFQLGTASEITYFNGDDALVLTKGDVVIDRFGKLGEDPGSAWTDTNDEDFSTANKTLRRKVSVTAGDTVADAEFPGTDNQWLTFDINTSDGLGCAGEGACETTPDPEPEPDVPCNNCENLTPVADPTAFDENVYYDTVLNGNFDTPAAMKDALSTVIANGHQQLTYKQVWSVLTYSDEDPNDATKVIELYTGSSISKFDNGGDQTDWNREHVWAKSHGFPSESQLGYTDAHHLRPTNVAVNSTRSNYDFETSNETGTELTAAPGNYVDGTARTFEPRDAVKGDVARMIFYMDTRYQGNDSNMPDLQLVDRVTSAEEVSANAPLHGKLCTLYAWHAADPVDAMDIQRNDAVYAYQGNRNPYIDRPELVQQVYGAQCGDDPNPPLAVELDIVAPESVAEGEAIALTASVTDGVDGVDYTFMWEQVSGDEVELVGEGASVTATAPLIDADTNLEFQVTVSDGSQSTFETVTVAVTNTELELDLTISGSTEVTEGDEVTLSADTGDYSGTELTYQWVQLGGEAVEFDATAATISFTTTEISMNQTLLFEVTVSDGVNSTSEQASVVVVNQQQSGWKEKDGGAVGGLIALLLPLAFWRRRRG